MKQETKRMSSIIIAALIVAGALVVYFEFIVPAYTTLETIKGQAQSEATLFANETKLVSQVQGLLTTYQGDASSSQSVAQALPVGQNVAGALAQVYGIAANTGFTVQQTGVSIQTISASPAAGGNQIANAAATGAVIKPTGTVSFQVTGSGSYESFKSFIKGLQTNIRLFDVVAVSISPATNIVAKNQAANPDMFSYTITVVTYYQAS